MSISEQLRVSEQLRIYEQIGFSLERARAAIALVQVAVEKFYECRQSSDYDAWERGKETTVEIGGKPYEVLARFALDEYWYGVTGVLRIDLKDLFTGDPGKAVRERVPLGFLLRSLESENELYLVFRGSQTKPEWRNQLAFIPGEKPFLAAELGTIHDGFQHMYTKENLGKRGDPKDDLVSIEQVTTVQLASCDPQATLYIVGHGLGAALATLATAHICHLGHFTKPPHLYAFAAPRVGDATFARYVAERCPHAFRIVNLKDAISAIPVACTHLPPESGLEQSFAESFETIAIPLVAPASILPDFDFYPVGQIVPFALHKGSVLDNHVASTYAEALLR